MGRTKGRKLTSEEKARSKVKQWARDENMSPRAREAAQVMLDEMGGKKKSAADHLSAKAPPPGTDDAPITGDEMPDVMSSTPPPEPVPIDPAPSPSSPKNPLEQETPPPAPPAGAAPVGAAGATPLECKSCGHCGRLGEPAPCPACGRIQGMVAKDVAPALRMFANMVLGKVPLVRANSAGELYIVPGESLAVTEEEALTAAEPLARVLTYYGVKPSPKLDLWISVAIGFGGVAMAKAQGVAMAKRLAAQQVEAMPMKAPPPPPPPPAPAPPAQA